MTLRHKRGPAQDLLGLRDFFEAAQRYRKVKIDYLYAKECIFITGMVCRR